MTDPQYADKPTDDHRAEDYPAGPPGYAPQDSYTPSPGYAPQDSYTPSPGYTSQEPFQPSGGYPPPGSYGAPQSAYPPPYPYPPAPTGYYDPMAPYGRDPQTGEPYSDKSKVVAGLLQLIGCFGLVGFGRIYLGQTGLGIAQLVVGLITCGIGAAIWGIIDAIMIFTGSVRDPEGRPLRNGA